jgi:hypothetical protein
MRIYLHYLAFFVVLLS